MHPPAAPYTPLAIRLETYAAEDDHAGDLFCERLRVCVCVFCPVLTSSSLMQDRPDLIVSELSGLAFDSLQQAFRPADLTVMFEQEPIEPRNSEAIYIAIDPAAGGPQSDYAMVSITRHKGMVTVSVYYRVKNRGRSCEWSRARILRRCSRCASSGGCTGL